MDKSSDFGYQKLPVAVICYFRTHVDAKNKVAQMTDAQILENYPQNKRDTCQQSILRSYNKEHPVLTAQKDK